MSKSNSVFISCLHGKEEDEWSSVFINVFNETASSFFKSQPTIFTSAKKPDKNSIGNARAWVMITAESEIETLQRKEELEQLSQIRKVQPHLPVFVIQQGTAIPEYIRPFVDGCAVYQFYDWDPDINQFRTYRLNGSDAEYTLFWSLLLDVLYDLAEVIEPEDKSSFAKDKSTVYIAPVTPELTVARNRIIRELTKRQITVLPDYRKDYNASDFDDLIKECDLAVHLVGYQYGELIADENISATEHYFRQTSAFCSKNKEFIVKKGQQVFNLVCLPLFPEKADEKQQQFIQSLRYDGATDSTEIVQLPVEDIKILIIERLNLKRRFRAKLEANSAYLMYESQSVENIEKISAMLQQAGYQPRSINYSDKKKSPIDQNRHYLSTSEIVIIIDDNAPDQWILAKIKDIVKAPGIGRLQPFKSKMVITQQEQKLSNIALHNGFTLLPFNDVSPEALKDQINKLSLP
jgi:hypothetical protein